MRIIVSLIAGLIFGLGLVISGMANPAKVQNFLDVFGIWDPSLAFVMAGAIAISAPGFLFAHHSVKPVFGSEYIIPANRIVDQQLLLGSATFGIGWGIVGLCPGPAIVALTGSMSEIVVFFAFMIAGLVVVKTLKSEPGIFSTT